MGWAKEAFKTEIINCSLNSYGLAVYFKFGIHLWKLLNQVLSEDNIYE